MSFLEFAHMMEAALVSPELGLTLTFPKSELQQTPCLSGRRLGGEFHGHSHRICRKSAAGVFVP